jgi:anti-anti-sigma factor
MPEPTSTSSPVQLSSEQHGDVWIVRVGETKLTYPVLGPFYARMRQIVDEGGRKLVIDLAGVVYVDSASIGCLLEVHRLFQGREGAVKLAGLQPRVQTMLAMTLVHKILDCHREVGEALAAFGEPRPPFPG